MELNLKNIGIAAGAYLAFVYLSKNKAERKANSFRMQIVDVDVDWQRIRIMLNFQNPTSGNIVIRSIVGDLYVNDSKLANVQSFGYFNVKANSQLVLPIEGRFKTAAVTNALMRAFAGNNDRFKIMFNGTINVNNEAIPLTFKYDYAR